MSMSTEALFTPIRIGPMLVKNRIAMSSTERGSPVMCRDSGDDAGLHEDHVAMYSARARGGVGIIIMEDTDVDSQTGAIAGYHTGTPGHPCLDRDVFIPAFEELAVAVHVFGAKIVPNLRHLGSVAIPKDGSPPLSASPTPSPLPSRFRHRRGLDAVEATPEQIAELQSKFAEAAFRAKRAGFDGVQLAGHHGFLINQFLSPLTNRRKDRFGGPLQNRMRFALELVSQVRSAIGGGMAIIFALSADDLVEGGLTLAESKTIAKELEGVGVDAIHVVPGTIFPWPHGHRAIPAMGSPHGVFVDIAYEIKKSIDIPVIANGRIKTPRLAPEIVAGGKADLVSMTRALIADPDWPLKVMQGREEDIIPCIACNFCLEAVPSKLTGRCTVNPDWGRELRGGLSTRSPKSVVVVGGGSAGLEAAITATLRGHSVRLFEKTRELGGQLNIAHLPPGKEEIAPFRDYLIRRARQLGVPIELGVTVHPELIKEWSPDVLIIATGATPVLLNGHGGSSLTIAPAWEVLKGSVQAGWEVVVAGGGATGCEVAEYLASRGWRVTILEMGVELARDMNPIGESMRYHMLERLQKYEVNVLLQTKFVRVDGREIVVEDKEGQIQGLYADTLVTSFGVVPNSDLDQLEMVRLVPEVYLVGDRLKPGNLRDATWSAARVAEAI